MSIPRSTYLRFGRNKNKLYDKQAVSVAPDPFSHAVTNKRVVIEETSTHSSAAISSSCPTQGV